MIARIAINVTRVDDEIRAIMGGTHDDIPVITFGPDRYTGPEIAINTQLLTPAEQISWLERLALAAEELSEQIRLQHHIEGNTANEGIVLVPLIRPTGGDVA